MPESTEQQVPGDAGTGAPDTGTLDQATPPTHLFLPTHAPIVPGYEIGEKIGEGGMGVVYAARDLGLDRAVAVKVMLPGKSATEFERESKMMARLPHPGIPPVHALGRVIDGRPFLAMKLIRGASLDVLLRARTVPTDDGWFVTEFEQVCQAVGYAHARGIVHRDLKPANIMVGAFGEVQVMDWGLAKFADAVEGDAAPAGPIETFSADAAATAAGHFKGTPAYTAPEQARGEPVNARADVFALGGILAEILTGRPPFAGGSRQDTLGRAARAELDEAFARLDTCGADAELIALAKWCLSARTVDRPADGEEVARAVVLYQNGVDARRQQAERDAARAVAERFKVVEQRKRRRVQLVFAGVTAVLLAAAGIATSLIIERRADDKLAAEQKQSEERVAAEKKRADERVAAEQKRQEDLRTAEIAARDAERQARQAAEAELAKLREELAKAKKPPE
jgi:hypothetical protein